MNKVLVACISSSKSSKTIMDFVYDKRNVTNAKIICTLKNVQSNFSFKFCESLSKLFHSIFLDIATAKSFTFRKDQCSYYMNYGIGSYYKALLINLIKASEYYSTSFDESLTLYTITPKMVKHIQTIS